MRHGRPETFWCLRTEATVGYRFLFRVIRQTRLLCLLSLQVPLLLPSPCKTIERVLLVTWVIGQPARLCPVKIDSALKFLHSASPRLDQGVRIHLITISYVFLFRSPPHTSRILTTAINNHGILDRSRRDYIDRCPVI